MGPLGPQIRSGLWRPPTPPPTNSAPMSPKVNRERGDAGGQVDAAPVAAPPLDELENDVAPLALDLDLAVQRQVAHGVQAELVGRSRRRRLLDVDCAEDRLHDFRVVGVVVGDQLGAAGIAAGRPGCFFGEPEPVIVGRHEVLVAEPDLLSGGAVDAELLVVFGADPVAADGVGIGDLGTPAGGPGVVENLFLHVVVVVHRLHHRADLDGRLAGDVPAFLALAAHEDVALADADRLVGQAHDSLDEVGFRSPGIVEDGHVETIRLAEGVGELAHENAVSFVGALRGLDAVVDHPHRVAAHRAGAGDDDLAAGAVGAGVDLVAGADLERILALPADDVLVPAHQGGGHRAGGNHKGLGLEGAEEKGEHKGDHHRLDHLAHRAGRTAGRPAGRTAGRPAGRLRPCGIGSVGFVAGGRALRSLLGHMRSQLNGSGVYSLLGVGLFGEKKRVAGKGAS